MRFRRQFALPIAALAIAFVASLLSAAEPSTPKKISFHRDVRPILRQHCQGCHQPAKAGGKLVLTSYADLLKAGESNEPGVVPGKPEASELFQQITSKGGKPPAMPQGKPPLVADDLAKIKQWIMEGAVDDSPPAERVVVDMARPPTYVLPPVLTSVQYSPDGKLLAVSGYHEVLLHEADGSGIEARLVGLSERVESAVFSPNGKFLAVTGGSPGRSGEVQIWDVAAKKLALSVTVGYDTIYGASWSPDGKTVAFGCPDNTVRAINAEKGQQVFQQGAHSDWVLDTTFSVDGAHIISVSRDMTAKLTEVATQRFEDNITSITPGALKGGLMSVDTRPKTDPKMADQIVLGGSDGEPKLYRIHRDKVRMIGDDANRLRTYEKMPGRVFSVRFSRDGKLLVAGCSYDDPKTGARLGEARVYQVDDGKRVSTFAGQPCAVYCAAFSPDAKQVAVGGFDGMVRLFDPQSGKLLKEFSAVPITRTVAVVNK